MAIDKSKLATLVKTQAKMPPIPAKLQKLGAAAPAKAPAAAAPAKPEKEMAMGNSDVIPFEEMTPQEKADLIETAAQAAEAQIDENLEDLLVDYAAGDMSQPPEWANDKELWQQVVEAVGLGTPDEEKYDEPYAVVAYLYSMLGGLTSFDMELSEEEVGEAEEEEGNDTAENEIPEGEGSDLKAMTDEAAEEAKNNPDEELQARLDGYNPETDGNPPQWVADEAKWEKAKAAVEENWESYDEPYAVVAYVYKNMGGGFK